MDDDLPPSPWGRPAPPAPPPPSPEAAARVSERAAWLLSIGLGFMAGGGAVLLIGAIIKMLT